MRKKAMAVLVILSLTVLLAFPAYASDDLRLQVNGGSFDVEEMMIVDDYSMISVDKFVYLTGADLSWLDGENFVIDGNFRTIPFTVGDPVATDAIGTIDLPVAPVRIDGVVYIPLRAVSEAMGFAVDWDGASRQVSLERDEVRDGMTALDLLVKSNLAQQDINTMGIDGNLDIKVNAMMGDESMVDDGFSMSMAITGEMQVEPLQVSIKQSISGAESMVVETYMVSDGIYTRVNGAEWIYMESPMVDELLESSMGIMSDPSNMTAYMKDMHKMVVYGNDQWVDGSWYYVVNAFMDADALASTIEDMVRQVAIGITDLNDPEMESVLTLMRNMQLDCRYTAWINKETFFSDIIKFDIKITLPIQLSDFMGIGETDGDVLDEFASQVVIMEMFESGALKMFDTGGVFNAPDVSGAVGIEDMRPDMEAGDGAEALEDSADSADSDNAGDEEPINDEE